MPRMQPGDEQSIQVHVYNEATFAPDALMYLWQRIQKNNLTKMIWSDGKPMPLNQFIRFYAPGNNRLLFLPTYQPEGANFVWPNVMGLCWLDDIVVGHKAFGHFIFFREWWGGWPQAAIEKVLKVGVFAPPLSLKMVICQGHVENAMSLALWKRMGIRQVGEFPYWYQHEDGYHSAVFGYILSPDVANLQVNVAIKGEVCEASQ